MADPTERTMELLRGDYLKHSDDIYASQIVSIAIKLCPSGLITNNDIMGKFDDTIKLVDSAKENH